MVKKNRVLWFERRENWNLFSTWEWHVPGTWGFAQERRRASPLRRKNPREGGWKRKILDISLFKVTHAFYVYNTLIYSSISCSLNEYTSVMSPLNATNRHAWLWIYWTRGFWLLFWMAITRCSVLPDTYFRPPKQGELLTTQRLGPSETKTFHRLFTFISGVITEVTARRYGCLQNRANRRINHAQKKRQIIRTTHFNKRKKLVDF